MIFFVIMGHCMELYPSPQINMVYKFIYSFHMPVFIFISGVLAKFNRAKIVKHILMPYLVFQTLYILCKKITGEEADYQYTTPYWILWFLLVILFYYILIPMLPPHKNQKHALISLCVSFLLALIVGFSNSIGYYLSLSRFFVFLPFFILGYYYQLIIRNILNNNKTKRIALILGIVCTVIGEIYIYYNSVPKAALFGSYCYGESQGCLLDRFVFLLTGLSWIVLFKCLTSCKPLPIISVIGRNTMPIFLFHGFVIRALSAINFFVFPIGMNLMISCIFALLIMLIFGNSHVGKAFHKIF